MRKGIETDWTRNRATLRKFADMPVFQGSQNESKRQTNKGTL